ncbi:hypothetical protein AB0I22_20980 [Streptomyces sp. NPDC050610]|uniref:hypothetical protein n=1 Tax=Streptomyces sp. NPDC050610 TaxID=3157097 RepID=UPI00343D6653
MITRMAGRDDELSRPGDSTPPHVPYGARHRRRTRGVTAAVFLAATSLLVTAAPSAVADPPPAPALTALPFLPGDWYSEPTGLNAEGAISGYSTPPDGIYPANYRDRAVRWAPDNSITALPPAPGDLYGRATEINAAGTTAGYSWSAGTSQSARQGHAVRWDGDGDVTPLAPLPGDTASRPAALNDAGAVAGSSWTGEASPDEGHGVVWEPDGTLLPLPALPGDTHSAPTGMNSAGEVVGYSWNGGLSARHAVKWSSTGVATDLGALVRATWPQHDAGVAVGINDSGTVIGQAFKAHPAGRSEPHAVKWGADGSVTDLGLNAGATSISAQGIMAGSRRLDISVRQTAVRWAPDGTAAPLALPGGLSGHGTGAQVNDAGTVVGDAWDGNPSRENKRGMRWAPDGTAIDLGSAPSDPYSSALFVNSGGTIAGVSIRTPLYTYLPGTHHAVVWRP